MKFLIALITALLATTAFSSFSLFSSLAVAHVDETISSVEDVVAEILSKQNVTTISQLDCAKIFDAEFEELGDALMERMAGSHELHEQMDAMMGGEGSESLRAMHVTMGENWLGCGSGSFQGMMNDGFGGMMSSSMMPMMMRMMGNYYPAYYAGYNTLLTFAVAGWLLLAVLLVFLTLVLTGRIKTQRTKK